MKLTIEQAMLKGASYQKKGEIDQARAVYQAVLRSFPRNKRAKAALEKLYQQQEPSIDEIANPPKDQIDTLIALYSTGRPADVISEAQSLIETFPSSFVLWNIIGAAHKALGDLEAAENAIRQASSANPNFPDAHNNLGIVLQGQGKLDEAIAAYKRTLALKPDYTAAYFNIGSALKDQGKLDEALTAYERALALKPDYPEVHNNIGNALKDQGKLDEAIAAYQRAIALKPDYPEAHNNMGNILKGQGRLDEAIAAYKRAIAFKSNNEVAYNNMGNLLKEQGKLDEAIASYKRALTLKPDYPEAYYNMGNALKDHRKLDEAISAYERALALKPDYPEAEAQIFHQKTHICNFSVSSLLLDASSRLGITTESVPPFAALSWADNSEHQLQRAKTFAKQKYKQHSDVLFERPEFRPNQLRVGYFSADFFDHPVMYLISGLLREHNKEKYKLFAYSYGRGKSGHMREEAKKRMDHFHDITKQSDSQIVDLARNHKLDIAIDLTGYTRNTRSGIFQYRVAPVQINYLGYPGSMGADFIDYIIADQTVIPQSQRQYYSENIIYLPHTYQPNDNLREIAKTNTTRADFDLPEDIFVFCCFNNNYKINLKEFNIWMRLLNKVDGSVLWLTKSNKWAVENLRREAANRGIAPERLVFAEKVSHSEHLSRHKHADLFVDTFNYNAHTTASDALWAGLPVVTKNGNQFAASVAASLLKAVNLPELITHTEEEYENLILELANNPQKLAAIKQKLAMNRLIAPLFDTTRYTQNFENGLERAYSRYYEGKEADDIWVSGS